MARPPDLNAVNDGARRLAAAQQLHRAGHFAAAIPFYEAASSYPEQRHLALLGLARSHAQLGTRDAAERALTDAITIRPQDPSAYGIKALLLVDWGGVSEAAEVIGQALARAPHSPALHTLSASIAIRGGRWDDALASVDAALAEAPQHRRALSYRPTILSELGQPEAARAALDLDRLVTVTRLDLPERTHGVIADAIAAAAVFKTLSPQATLVGGARLPDLSALTAELRRPLVNAVRDLPGLREYRTVPGTSLEFWATVMQAGHFEKVHIHEQGWVSGVYYPENVPPGSALVFGGIDLPVRSSGPTRRIEPRAGDVVLFPSYAFHRTEPHAGPGRRISVAFDLRMPTAWSRQ